MTPTLSLGEFQRLSGLSDRSLVRLLIAGLLPCLVDSQGRVSIDISRLDMQQFSESVLAVVEQRNSEDTSILAEDISALVERELESIVDEAIDILQGERWLQQAGKGLARANDDRK